MINAFTIGRHGSFQLRYGWITKGIRAVNDRSDAKKLSDVFTSDDATVNLGVGKNTITVTLLKLLLNSYSLWSLCK